MPADLLRYDLSGALTLRDVEDQARELARDPEALAKVQRRCDPLAARAFYRDLATLAPDALVDDLPCPLYCFWGDQDTDAVEMVLSHADYMAGLNLDPPKLWV